MSRGALCYDPGPDILAFPMPCFDFHCHSTVSDGLLPPDEVVRRAAANGVDVLALTDHDDTGGLALARATAAECGIRLVNGVEISIEWDGVPIHILGLGVDDAAPALVDGLASIRGGRVERARRMAAALAEVGIDGAFDGAMAFAANPSLISRAHFARFLASRGYAASTHKVFESYLVPGKPGYVAHEWATLRDSVGWIRAAGGVAVVAHPGRYKLTTGAMTRFLADFKDCGGQGIEVLSGGHTADHVERFARIARKQDFYASAGSDFHGPGESHVDLGGLPPLAADLRPVAQLLV
jgi:predicted metal-dependent phosphoesterase TrpH